MSTSFLNAEFNQSRLELARIKELFGGKVHRNIGDLRRKHHCHQERMGIEKIKLGVRLRLALLLQQKAMINTSELHFG